MEDQMLETPRTSVTPVATKPQWLVRQVMALSGGIIREEKHAHLILIGICMVMIVSSFFILRGTPATPDSGATHETPPADWRP